MSALDWIRIRRTIIGLVLLVPVVSIALFGSLYVLRAIFG